MAHAEYSKVKYVDMLPESFKTLIDSSSTDPFVKYEVNPVLTTAVLLDYLNEKLAATNAADETKQLIADFDLDLVFPGVTPASALEVKSLFSFKGTSKDLTYALRRFGVSATLEKVQPSRLTGTAKLIDNIDPFIIDNSDPPMIFNSLTEADVVNANSVKITVLGDLQTINQAVVTDIIYQMLYYRLPTFVHINTIEFVEINSGVFDDNRLWIDHGTWDDTTTWPGPQTPSGIIGFGTEDLLFDGQRLTF